jgi:integrase
MSKIEKSTKWRKSRDKQLGRFVIRRDVYLKNGQLKQERYPHFEYKKFDKDELKVQEFLNKLNYRILKEEERKKNWEIQTSFLDTSLTGDAFYKYIYENTENEQYSQSVVSRVKKYFVDFFTAKKEYDYIQWQTLKSQRSLVNSLLKRELSIKTIITIRQNINQFYRFLHEESEGEIDLYKVSFPSLKNIIKKKHEVKRKSDNKFKDKRLSGDDYISEEILEKIIKRCKSGFRKKHFPEWAHPLQILPNIWLSYFFGLRRAETISIKVDDIKKDFLNVSRQQKNIKETKSLKHIQEKREVPHYYHDKEELLKTATIISKVVVMHPSTLTRIWGYLMEDMGYRFTYHNLRNSFCSNLFRDMNKLDISPADIQFSMGHKDIRTSMKYLRNYKKLDGAKPAFKTTDFDSYDLEDVI